MLFMKRIALIVAIIPAAAMCLRAQEPKDIGLGKSDLPGKPVVSSTLTEKDKDGTYVLGISPPKINRLIRIVPNMREGIDLITLSCNATASLTTWTTRSRELKDKPCELSIRLEKDTERGGFTIDTAMIDSKKIAEDTTPSIADIIERTIVNVVKAKAPDLPAGNGGTSKSGGEPSGDFWSSYKAVIVIGAGALAALAIAIWFILFRQPKNKHSAEPPELIDEFAVPRTVEAPRETFAARGYGPPGSGVPQLPRTGNNDSLLQDQIRVWGDELAKVRTRVTILERQTDSIEKIQNKIQSLESQLEKLGEQQYRQSEQQKNMTRLLDEIRLGQSRVNEIFAPLTAGSGASLDELVKKAATPSTEALRNLELILVTLADAQSKTRNFLAVACKPSLSLDAELYSIKKIEGEIQEIRAAAEQQATPVNLAFKLPTSSLSRQKITDAVATAMASEVNRFSDPTTHYSNKVNQVLVQLAQAAADFADAHIDPDRRNMELQAALTELLDVCGVLEISPRQNDPFQAMHHINSSLVEGGPSGRVARVIQRGLSRGSEIIRKANVSVYR